MRTSRNLFVANMMVILAILFAFVVPTGSAQAAPVEKVARTQVQAQDNCNPPKATKPQEWWSDEIVNEPGDRKSSSGKISGFTPGAEVDVTVEGHSDAEFNCGDDQIDEIASVDIGDKNVTVVDGQLAEKVTVIADENGKIYLKATALGNPGSMFVYVVGEAPPPYPDKLTLNAECPTPGVDSEDLTVNGQLEDQNGNPMGGFEIEMSLPDGSTKTVTTDADGNFSYLFAGAKSYVGQNIVATAGELSKSLTITLGMFEQCVTPAEPKTISIRSWCPTPGLNSDNLVVAGTVEDQYGNVMPDVDVKLSLPNGESHSVNTDSNGNYTYTFVGAKAYVGKDVDVTAGKASNKLTITESMFELCVTPTEDEGPSNDCIVYLAKDGFLWVNHKQCIYRGEVGSRQAGSTTRDWSVGQNASFVGFVVLYEKNKHITVTVAKFFVGETPQGIVYAARYPVNDRSIGREAKSGGKYYHWREIDRLWENEPPKPEK